MPGTVEERLSVSPFAGRAALRKLLIVAITQAICGDMDIDVDAAFKKPAPKLSRTSV